jgi:hypothetical protein
VGGSAKAARGVSDAVAIAAVSRAFLRMANVGSIRIRGDLAWTTLVAAFACPLRIRCADRSEIHAIRSLTEVERPFYWQTGHGAFSVSPSHVEALTKYITNQEEHRKVAFQDELRRLCKKYGVEIDERYVWD